MESSIGIIGGADGPTAIMVAGDWRGIALIAAGIILVREAGGFVTSADGGAEPLAARSVAAGNESLHGDLVKLLRRANA
jgi:fructose-1,6-bisphosphatase/inositol monophosphatase family enzyme